MYKIVQEYFIFWTSEFTNELKHFQWMTLADGPDQEKAEETIDVFFRKNLHVNDCKFFDQRQDFIKVKEQHKDDYDCKKKLALKVDCLF